MADVRFIVADMDPNAANYGQLEALDSANATALPVPAFRVGRARPVAGTLIGEGFINELTGEGSVWTNNGWLPMSPPVLARYPTDTDVLNDNAAQTGTYGLATSTGNLYAKTPTGWRMIGARIYPQLAGLLLDAPAEGTIGVELFGSSVWIRGGGRWNAATMFHYATEAMLLATNLPDGVVAVAGDTGLAYSRVNGGWRRMNSPTMTVAPAAPTTPAQGDLWFDDATATGMVWTGAQWASMNSEPIGEVKMFAGRTAPPNFLLCDGAAIPPQFPVLIALIGPNTPNLLLNGGSFPRFGTPENNFPQHQDTTRLPRTPFTTNNPGNHTHTMLTRGHVYSHSVASANIGQGDGSAGSDQRPSTDGSGGHTHTISGGDSETAGKFTRLLPIIRAA